MKQRDILRLLVVAGLFLGLLASVANPLTRAVAIDEKGLSLPVFMYHHVTDTASYWGRDSISVTELEEDLKTLCTLGYHTVHLSQVEAYVNGRGILPPNPVVLTFDDGFLNYRDTVVPLLEKYHCCATVAITGRFADNAESRLTDNANFEYMTWAEIGDLAKETTEIAYHSYDSHYATSQHNGRKGMKKRSGESQEAYRVYLQQEYRQFAEKAEQHGFTPMGVAYPYGLYSDCTDGVFKDLGLNVTFTCESGINYLRQGDMTCLQGIKRINRPHGVSSAEFFGRNLPFAFPKP